MDCLKFFLLFLTCLILVTKLACNDNQINKHIKVVACFTLARSAMKREKVFY